MWRTAVRVRVTLIGVFVFTKTFAPNVNENGSRARRGETVVSLRKCQRRGVRRRARGRPTTTYAKARRCLARATHAAAVDETRVIKRDDRITFIVRIAIGGCSMFACTRPPISTCQYYARFRRKTIQWWYVVSVNWIFFARKLGDVRICRGNVEWCHRTCCRRRPVTNRAYDTKHPYKSRA